MASPAADACEASPKSHKQLIRVLIADGTPMGCELLQKALSAHRRIEVAATVVTVKDLMGQIRRTPVDALLLNADLQEGQRSGIRAATELHAVHPKLPIVILCDYADDDLVISSFRAGARGVLCRSQPIGMLTKCIQAVHCGEIWASNRHLQILLGALATSAPARVTNVDGLNLLAEREGQVVSLVVDGFTNKDIAARLNLSEHTVSNYLFRIYNKLGVSNRVELVLCVMKQREKVRIAS